jgi:hypothetical protein
MMTRQTASRRTSGLWDWITSGASTDATGAPLGGASIVGWGGFQTVANNVAVTSQAVVIPPSPAASTPGIGRLRIEELRGQVSFRNFGASADTFDTWVCVYVSDMNFTTTLWNVRNPSVAADVSRDDYLYLQHRGWGACVATATTALDEVMEFELSISQPVVIGGGQALHISVISIGRVNTMNTMVSWNYRARVGPVA